MDELLRVLRYCLMFCEKRWWWLQPWWRLVAAFWNDQREWQVSCENFPANSGLTFPATARASLARILLETGITLTPAKSVFTPSAWFALFRYIEAFSPRSGYLRLVPAADEWDSRLVTILAEELAVGVAAYLARKHVGVVHIADVAPLLDKDELRIKAPPFSPKHPGARPDYLGVLGDGQAVVFEAKGAVGTRSRLKEPLKKGYIQVRNIDFVAYQSRSVNGAPACDRLVFATHFCTEGKHSRSETTTVVLDPPSNSPKDIPRRESDFAVRVAYAKVMNLAGLPLAARSIMLGREVEELKWLESVVVDKIRLRILGPFPGAGVLVLEDGVARSLITSAGHDDIRDSVAKALRLLQEFERDVQSEDELDLILLNNGVGLWLPNS